MATDLTDEARAGYDAAIDSANPHYWSSPAGMGWDVGRYLGQRRMPRPIKAAMSRGMSVRVDGQVYSWADGIVMPR